jgi:tetratricopeptide (TPR) repeat protein
MRATLDWSYQLLSESAQAFLAGLSVFRGGWTLSAAQAVCALSEEETLEQLTLLRDSSLIEVTDTNEGLRFTLLETVREYAAEHLERLGKQDDVQRRHRDYFLALAEEASCAENRSTETAWYDRLEAEHDNLRAALERCQEIAVQTGLQLASSLLSFWERRGYLREGRQHLSRLLGQEGGPDQPAIRAAALHAAGILSGKQADYPAARRFHEECLALRQQLGDKQDIADALRCLGNAALALDGARAARSYYEQALILYRAIGNRRDEAGNLSNLGIVSWNEGDDSTGRSYFEQSVTIFRSLGDRKGETYGLTNLGHLAREHGDFAAARSYFEQVLAINRTLDDRGAIASDLLNLGETLGLQGDNATARVHLEQAIALSRDLGEQSIEAEALLCLGRVAHREGDYGQARALIRQSLHLWHQIGSRKELPEPLEAFAELLALQNELKRAVCLYGAAHAWREQLHLVRPPIQREPYQAGIEALRGALGEEAFSNAWEAGTAMTLEEAIQYALVPS